MARTSTSTRKRQPISPSKIPASHHQEERYQDPNAKRMKTQRSSRTIHHQFTLHGFVFSRSICLDKTSNSNLPLWRDISPTNDHNSSTNSSPLFYSFYTDNKQCLATSYMSSRGHCCLCQFTAVNNDLEVLIKHLSYCHPRFTASLKVFQFFFFL